MLALVCERICDSKASALAMVTTSWLDTKGAFVVITQVTQLVTLEPLSTFTVDLNELALTLKRTFFLATLREQNEH